MEQYTVTGMSCAACSARVEKAVSKVPGVESCSVSLLTNSMGVEGSADAADIIAAVKEAGYGASVKGSRGGEDGAGSGPAAGGAAFDEDALADHETPVLKKRLFSSLGFLAVLMYFSMGHMMWGWPVPEFFADNHVAMGLLQLLLSAAVMVINQKFFINGFKGLLHRAPNMDTLVALGSAASFGWSVYALFEMLEARSKGRTTDALKGLMKLAPKTAVVERDGVETEVPIAQVKKGDIFAALTGESIPADKGPGDMVSAATVNQSGFIRCEASRVGEDKSLMILKRCSSE